MIRCSYRTFFAAAPAAMALLLTGCAMKAPSTNQSLAKTGPAPSSPVMRASYQEPVIANDAGDLKRMGGKPYAKFSKSNCFS